MYVILKDNIFSDATSYEYLVSFKVQETKQENIDL